MQSGKRLTSKDYFAKHSRTHKNHKKATCKPWNGESRNGRVSVKAGTPPGTPGTHPEHPEPHPEHPEPYPEHPEPHPEPPESHPEHPEPHPEHAGIQAMKQRTCFSINSRVSH